mmetsp:Transcript_83373/g.223015  ORF Transcript_83373/g.223015 Transcript_83373/m.223015 type:complete len:218 (-) Transcript_83373:549-1202(-)
MVIVVDHLPQHNRHQWVVKSQHQRHWSTPPQCLRYRLRLRPRSWRCTIADARQHRLSRDCGGIHITPVRGTILRRSKRDALAKLAGRPDSSHPPLAHCRLSATGGSICTVYRPLCATGLLHGGCLLRGMRRTRSRDRSWSGTGCQILCTSVGLGSQLSEVSRTVTSDGLSAPRHSLPCTPVGGSHCVRTVACVTLNRFRLPVQLRAHICLPQGPSDE